MAAPPSQPMHITVRTEGQSVHVEIAGIQPFATGEARTVEVTIRQQSSAAASEAVATHAQALGSGPRDVEMVDEATSTHDQPMTDDESSDGEYQPDDELDSGDEEVNGASRLGVERVLRRSDGVVAAKDSASMLTSTVSIQQFRDQVLTMAVQVIPEDKATGELIADVLSKLADAAYRLATVDILRRMAQRSFSSGRINYSNSAAWAAIKAELPDNALVQSEEFKAFIKATESCSYRQRDEGYFLSSHYHSAGLIKRVYRARGRSTDWPSLLEYLRAWFTQKRFFQNEDYLNGLTLVVIYSHARYEGNLWLQGGWQDYAKLSMQARINTAALQTFFGPGVLLPVAARYCSDVTELDSIPPHALFGVLHALEGDVIAGYQDIWQPLETIVKWYCEPAGGHDIRAHMLFRDLEKMRGEDAQSLSCQAFFKLVSTEE